MIADRDLLSPMPKQLLGSGIGTAEWQALGEVNSKQDGREE